MTSAEQTEAIRKTMEAEKQASRDELVSELVEALREARDNMAAWASYASDYFQEKHDLDGDLDKIDTVLRKAGAL